MPTFFSFHRLFHEIIYCIKAKRENESVVKFVFRNANIYLVHNTLEPELHGLSVLWFNFYCLILYSLTFIMIEW